MEIRKLRAADAKAVNELLKRTVKESLSSSTTQEGIYYYTNYYSIKTLKAASKNKGNINLVITENKKIIGAVLSPVEGGIAFLHFVVIDEAYRNKGFGKKCLLYYIQKCQELGCHKIELYVNPEKKWKIKLYKKLGFKKIYNKKKMWFNQDVVYMLKELNST